MTASIVLAVSDIFVMDIKLKQSGNPVAPGEAVDYEVYEVAWQFNSLFVKEVVCDGGSMANGICFLIYSGLNHSCLCSKAHRVSTGFRKALSYYH